jgi:hypothetical protein
LEEVKAVRGLVEKNELSVPNDKGVEVKKAVEENGNGKLEENGVKEETVEA